MYTPVHFYMTFNPHFNDYVEPGFTQAHDFFDYLKEELKKNPDGYAYWGRMMGKDRDSQLDLESFEKVIQENREHHFSTHLYITDFKNIWVGKVESVHKGIGKDFKTLKFYKDAIEKKDKKVDVWFKIVDFTLLEYCHETTASKLSELYIDNDYMDLKIDELSPFTSGIRYPAFVQDLAEEMFFDEFDKSETTHLALLDHPAINNSGSGQVIKVLNLYAFPDKLYNKIPHSAKFEIETSEMDMLEHRHHNLKKVAFSYIKALEIIINDLTIHHLKRQGLGEDFFVNPHVMPPKLYLDSSDTSDDVVPIADFQKNYSINQLVYFAQKAKRSNRMDFARAYGKHKPFLKFITEDLPRIMEENQLLSIRGVLAHSDSDSLSDEDALAIRNLILGVGCSGLIQMAYQSFYHEELKGVSKIQGNYQDKTKVKSAPKKRHLKIA